MAKPKKHLFEKVKDSKNGQTLKTSSNGVHKFKSKPWGFRKPFDLRKASVPECWHTFLDSMFLEGVNQVLQPSAPYRVTLQSGGYLQIIFDADMSLTVLVSKGPQTVLDSGGLGPAVTSIRFKDAFIEGYPSYAFFALAILAIAILIHQSEVESQGSDAYDEDEGYVDEQRVVDILQYPLVKNIHDFLKDDGNHCPTEEFVKLFSSSGNPRFIRSRGENIHSYEYLSLCLLGKQTMLVSTGIAPNNIREMLDIDLALVPDIITNALVGIAYAFVLDEKAKQVSIGILSRTDGGPGKSKV